MDSGHRKYRFKSATRWVQISLALVLVAGMSQAISASSNAAPSTVRINAGGPATTVNGTAWSGCSSLTTCNGYASGGFPWVQTPTPTVSGYTSNTTAAMHQKEWTGGQTNGIAYGATAFAFNVPVVANNDYQVILHFTELNKTAVGQRVFDVKLDNSTVLSNFDVFQAAGGEYKTITRTFSLHDTAGMINISFIRRVENAKVDAIEVIPAASTTTTTTAPGSTTTTTTPSSTTSTSTTSTTSTSTTSTTSTTSPSTTTSTTTPPQPTGTNINWSTIASPPFRSAESSGGIINNKLYVFGGFMPPSWTTPTTGGAVYDIASNTWSSLPPAPMGMSHAGRVIDGHNFIFAGGVDEVNGTEVWAVQTVLEFNTDTNTWSHLPNLPIARGSMGAALIGRNLHAFGGVDGNKNVHSDHWVLNLDNLSAGWQTAAAFPSPRSHFAAVVVNNNSIYAMGGLTGWESTAVELKDIYRYDASTNSWTRLADMPIARSHVSDTTMVIGGNVWMFGGEVKYPDGSSDIYVYNISTDTWKKAAASLPQARFAGVADHINNTVFYINGTFYDSSVWKGTIS